MNHLTRFCPAIIVTTAISLLISGCTLAGGVTGALIDARDPTKFPLNGKLKVEQGDPVEVISFQGDTIRGLYRDSIALPFVSYKESFEHAQRVLPDILRDNDTVRIVLDDGRTWQGTVTGFDPEIIKFNWIRSGKAYPVDVPMEKILSLASGDGEPVLRDTLRSWMGQGLIPSHSGIVIERDSTRVTIPLLSVKSMTEIKANTHYVWYLALGGLVIDAIVVISSVNISMKNIGSGLRF